MPPVFIKSCVLGFSKYSQNQLSSSEPVSDVNRHRPGTQCVSRPNEYCCIRGTGARACEPPLLRDSLQARSLLRAYTLAHSPGGPAKPRLPDLPDEGARCHQT